MVKKHKNKIISLLLLVILCMSFSLSVFASNVIDDIIDKDKNDNMDTLTTSQYPTMKNFDGLSFSKDWVCSDYSNVVEYPHIIVSGSYITDDATQTYIEDIVYTSSLDKYICVGYIVNGCNNFFCMVYDKDTREFIYASTIYHSFVVRDVSYTSGGPGYHEETEGGSLYGYSFYDVTLQYSNIPVFGTREACDRYAKTFVADNAYYVPSSMKCESPQNISIYCDNNNKYLFNCVWYQTNSITSNYRTNIELIYYYVKGQEFSESKKITLNNAYVTSNDNSISFNVSDIVSSLNIGFMCDEIRFIFKCTNYDVTGVMCSSDSSIGVVRVFPDSVLFEYYDEHGKLVESVPLKTETQYKNDNGYSISDFTNIDTYTNEGFLNSILSGFGLIGNGGLIPLLTSIYHYVPSDIWVLICAGLSFMIIVAIFKLVVK